jgi:hypothetical protein
MIIIIKLSKFPIGSLVATANAEAKFSEEILQSCLNRHASGDWGDLCAEDIQSNEQALEFGSRLFSSYEIPEQEKLWIITEADRSVTTFLLPEDY